MTAMKPSSTCNLTANIRWYMERSGITPKELARSMRMCEATFYARLKNPGEFKVEELERCSARFRVDLGTLLFGAVGVGAVGGGEQHAS